jgi:tRNA G37 N-methylase TrmD
MVMQAQPIYDCYQHIRSRLSYEPRVVYLTPRAGFLTRIWLRSSLSRRALCFCAVIMRA